MAGRGSEAAPVRRGRVQGEGTRDRAPAREPAGRPSVPGTDEEGARGGGQGASAPRLAGDRVGKLPDPGRGGRGGGAGAVPAQLRAAHGAREEGGGGVTRTSPRGKKRVYGLKSSVTL